MLPSQSALNVFLLMLVYGSTGLVYLYIRRFKLMTVIDSRFSLMLSLPWTSLTQCLLSLRGENIKAIWIAINKKLIGAGLSSCQKIVAFSDGWGHCKSCVMDTLEFLTEHKMTIHSISFPWQPHVGGATPFLSPPPSSVFRQEHCHPERRQSCQGCRCNVSQTQRTVIPGLSCYCRSHYQRARSVYAASCIWIILKADLVSLSCTSKRPQLVSTSASAHFRPGFIPRAWHVLVTSSVNILLSTGARNTRLRTKLPFASGFSIGRRWLCRQSRCAFMWQ